MIVLGVILVIIGFIAAVHTIWILGTVAAFTGAILAIVGMGGARSPAASTGSKAPRLAAGYTATMIETGSDHPADDEKGGSQVVPDKPPRDNEPDTAPGQRDNADDDRLPRGQHGPTADYGKD